MDDDDEFLYGDDSKPKLESDVDENNEVDYEEDSEDDVEIVIAGTATNAQASAKPVTAAETAHDAKLALKPTSTKPVAVGMPIPKQDSSAANAVTSKQGFDIDAVGQHDGKDIFDVDLESFDDKPWRKPGADITDYFNYGLNENTWKAYCQKQKMMRDQAMMHSNPYGLPNQEVDFGFDMQAFVAQQRMLGAPVAPYPVHKYQRIQQGQFIQDNHMQRPPMILGKRPRDDSVVQVLSQNTDAFDFGGGYSADNSFRVKQEDAVQDNPPIKPVQEAQGRTFTNTADNRGLNAKSGYRPSVRISGSDVADAKSELSTPPRPSGHDSSRSARPSSSTYERHGSYRDVGERGSRESSHDRKGERSRSRDRETRRPRTQREDLRDRIDNRGRDHDRRDRDRNR